MIYLKEIEEGDLGLLDIARWRNQSLSVLRSAGLTAEDMSSQNKWVKRWKEQGDLYYFIYGKDHYKDLLLGYCGLDKIDSVNKSAEVSLLIAPESRGIGLGTRAIKDLLSIVFCKLELNRVFIEVYKTAETYIFWDSVGFIQEGVLRETKKWDGKFHNSIVASILRDEYFGGLK